MTSASRDALHEAADRFVLHGFKADRHLIFTRGLGARLWDSDGREYLDSVSGTMGPAMVGHGHPAVVEAVAAQMKTLASTFYIYDNEPLVRFAERLAELAPGGLSKTLLCPGGGDAIEAAVKLAMRVTGRTEVLSLDGAYHGMSLATMSLGGMPALRSWVPGGMRWPTFRQVPSPHTYLTTTDMSEAEATAAAAGALASAIDGGSYGSVAALVIEVVQGPGGHVVFPEPYYAEVQRICAERDVLLIVDEVQTGLGRCGTTWACDLFGLEPDMLVIGKAFGGGVPFGGVVARDDLVSSDVEEHPWHLLTFMNQPLQAAAGSAVVRVVEEEDLVARAAQLGARARNRFEELARDHELIHAVRGPGLFLAVELLGDRESLQPAVDACRRALDHAIDIGLLTWLGGAGNVLKFKPPLITSDEDFERMLELFCDTVEFAVSNLGGG